MRCFFRRILFFFLSLFTILFALPVLAQDWQEYSSASDQNAYYPTAPDYVQLYGWVDPLVFTVQDDFMDLYIRNRDLVGWLWAGDGINYPVVQFDNEYYLHHDYDGNDSQDGTLFVNEFNSLWPRDWMLLIHGHHMRSGAMFGRLQAFESYDYLCQYPIVTFRTICDAEDVYYVPIAGFNASMNEDDPTYFFVMEPWLFYEEELWRLIPHEEETETPEEAEMPGETEMPEETKMPEDFNENAPAEEKPSPEAASDDTQDTNASDDASDDTHFSEAADETAAGPDSPEFPEQTPPTEAISNFPTEDDLQKVDVNALNTNIDARKVQYLTEILDRSLWITPVPITTGDTFLMLSTCSYYQDNGRFMLLCRRLRDDETPEYIWNLFH